MKKVRSMARKYHTHTLQTNPSHHKEETQRSNSHMTLKAILRQPALTSLPQRDDCKTRNYTKKCTTKQGPNTKKHKQ